MHGFTGVEPKLNLRNNSLQVRGAPSSWCRCMPVAEYTPNACRCSHTCQIEMFWECPVFFNCSRTSYPGPDEPSLFLRRP